jgi:DNA-binding CsgD family transcriptional regulator
MDEHGDALAQARRAAATRDWPTAAAQFDVLESEQLSADDLAAHADAVWWLGRTDDALRLGAAAYDAFLADSRPVEAAMSAMRLGMLHVARGDEQQGSGWLRHAGRLAAGIPECALHGYVASFTEVELRLFAGGEPAAVVDAARQVQGIGRRFDTPELVAVGLHGEGRALIRLGQVIDGLAMLDEAMVAILHGQFDPFLTTALYCNAIAACHDVGDVRRMTRWTDLTERWLASLPVAVVFNAMCRVHRAHVQLLRGEWDDAERGALEVVALLDANRVDYAAEAWYVVAEVRRLRGDPSAADAYDETHARGRDPQPGRALLRLQQGDAAGAATMARSAVAAAGADPLHRAPVCAAMVEIALAAGRLEDAAAAESELAATAARYATSGLEATAAAARGAVLLAEGRPAHALPVLRDACRRWHELGAVCDAAHTSLQLAETYRALGDEVSAAAEVAKAQAIFDRLGAHRPGPEPPDGLTRRECEVLALVAEGRSNLQIGEALYISDRTVARHLTNIFHKIGVTSRTQAARYTLDRGLSTSR